MIYVIGMGVEGKESLSKKALDIIGRAGLVAGGRRHLEEFRALKARKVAITGGIDALMRSIRSAGAGGTVAVLATGDPLLFGIGDALLREFGKRSVTVMPNVSVVQEAFARIKESANGVKTISVHGRTGGLEGLVREAAREDKLAVFTDAQNSPGRIAAWLLKKGMNGFRVHVCESIGAKDERVISGSLKTIAAKRRFAPLNVMILIKEKDTNTAQAQGARRFGVQDFLFSHSSNMITKEELRAIALSKLDLKDDSVVWDVGSGCGSVAIEAARLSPLGFVYAIEKERPRAALIKKNRAAFGVKNLEVVNGAAPGCLGRLPAPDAVFVGGGGGGLPPSAGVKSILETIAKRLQPGGRAVVSAITLETAGEATGFFKRKKWGFEAALVSITKAKDLRGRSMLSAANPVFIITAVKP